MQKWSSKLESTWKTEQDRSCWNFLTRVKVNGQRLTCANIAVWHHLRAYMAVRKRSRRVEHVGHMGKRGNWRVRSVGARERHWQCVAARGARAREVETSGSAWGRVLCSFWPFLVGFCSGLAVLSLYAFAFTVGWTERWYLKVVGTVGLTAMTRFCQWLLSEGEGSERTPEMSIGTRKSDEWLWYHIKNIKWERKTE